MDPTACWERIRSALLASDTLEAVDAAIDLAGWLNGGGLLPDIDDLGRSTRDSGRVWAVLNFLLELDPDDSLRDESAE